MNLTLRSTSVAPSHGFTFAEAPARFTHIEATAITRVRSTCGGFSWRAPWHWLTLCTTPRESLSQNFFDPFDDLWRLLDDFLGDLRQFLSADRRDFQFAFCRIGEQRRVAHGLHKRIPQNLGAVDGHARRSDHGTAELARA